MIEQHSPHQLVSGILKIEDAVAKIIDKLLAVILFFILVSVLAIILARFVNNLQLNYAITGWYSLCSFAFIYASILGTTSLFLRGNHVSILILYEKFSHSAQVAISIFNYLLMMAMHIFILVYSVSWIKTTGQYIIVSLNMPRYPFQFSLILMSVLIIIFSALKVLSLFFSDKSTLQFICKIENR